MLLINLQDILGFMKWLLAIVPPTPYSPLTLHLRRLQTAPFSLCSYSCSGAWPKGVGGGEGWFGLWLWPGGCDHVRGRSKWQNGILPTAATGTCPCSLKCISCLNSISHPPSLCRGRWVLGELALGEMPWMWPAEKAKHCQARASQDEWAPLGCMPRDSSSQYTAGSWTSWIIVIYQVGVWILACPLSTVRSLCLADVCSSP